MVGASVRCDDVVVVRVLVADDHEAFLDAARAVVTATAGFELVALARSGEDAVALCRSLAVDLAVVDINMPGVSGVEAARRILRARPATRALLVSTYREEDLPHPVRSCGAPYAHKESFGPELLRSVWNA